MSLAEGGWKEKGGSWLGGSSRVHVEKLVELRVAVVKVPVEVVEEVPAEMIKGGERGRGVRWD